MRGKVANREMSSSAACLTAVKPDPPAPQPCHFAPSSDRLTIIPSSTVGILLCGERRTGYDFGVAIAYKQFSVSQCERERVSMFVCVRARVRARARVYRCMCMRERERETDRQTDRDRDRERQKQRDRDREI